MEEKDKCCRQHPFYDTLFCEKPKGHEGLHSALMNYETLKWGIPTYEEMYDCKRTK